MNEKPDILDMDWVQRIKAVSRHLKPLVKAIQMSDPDEVPISITGLRMVLRMIECDFQKEMEVSRDFVPDELLDDALETLDIILKTGGYDDGRNNSDIYS